MSLSCVELFCKLIDCSAPSSFVHKISVKNTGVGCRFLLQEIFPTQGSNLCVLHCRRIFSPLSHMGSPDKAYTTPNHIDLNDETQSTFVGSLTHLSTFPEREGSPGKLVGSEEIHRTSSKAEQ